MEASKSLRRPENWQEFERLCKKLWGEIWNCPEIKLNGRNGQSQHGVDIYGIPLGQEGYYGIQCKGKDEYSNKQFTEEEITREIELAKSFQPKLKKLYFATTAVKDTKIEEFIRKKNLENTTTGLFEVHIFSWEDIVDLIDENRQTHDWYLKNQNYKTRKSVAVTFEDGATEMLSTPKFKKGYILHRQKNNSQPQLLTNIGLNFAALNSRLHHLSISKSDFLHKVNLSFAGFSIKVQNVGSEAIEEYKVLLEFEGEFQDLKDTNEEKGFATIIPRGYIPTTYLYPESKSGKLIPRKSILVGDDFFSSDAIFIKPHPVDTKIIIKWKLISKDFKDNGELILNIAPTIENSYEYVLVENIDEVKIEETGIEDYYVPKQTKG